MNWRTTGLLLTVAIFVGYLFHVAFALPSGATITSNETAGTPSSTPGNLTQARGTITTVIINGLQQDQNWKGYVGNITGRLSLDDASGYTIYDWPISSVNKTGEVYVSRSSSPEFSSVECATDSNITAEQIFHNMTNTQTDNITATFNYTKHSQFYVGTQSIAADSCRSLATYINDARQNDNGNQKFQEILLRDSLDNILFATIINSNVTGYDNARQFDFQLIVPESAIKSSPTTYFFYTELSG